MKTKYRVHIAGPDDVLECKSEISALRTANEINMFWLDLRKNMGKDTPLCVATVTKVEGEE